MRATLRIIYYLSGVINAVFGINRRIKFEYWINIAEKVRIDILKSLALISVVASISIFGLFYTTIGSLILLVINVVVFVVKLLVNKFRKKRK